MLTLAQRTDAYSPKAVVRVPAGTSSELGDLTEAGWFQDPRPAIFGLRLPALRDLVRDGLARK